jgi:hypothetical protein
MKQIQKHTTEERKIEKIDKLGWMKFDAETKKHFISYAETQTAETV